MRKHRKTSQSDFAYESLEARKMLASLQIFGAGLSGNEQISLNVAGTEVAVFDDLGTGANSGDFQTLSYTSAHDIAAEDVKIEFTNDRFDADNRVRIDAIQIDGVRHETESPTVYSTGTWLPEDGFQPGFRQSEILHNNGYFQFGGSSITIWARGSEGFEQFQLQVAGETVEEFVASQSLQAYNFHSSTAVSADDIRIEFVNAQWNWSAGIDTNLFVDRISIDGRTFQTEDATVYSTGTWEAGNGVTPGYKQNQHLHTNGFFEFADTENEGSLIRVEARGAEGFEQFQLEINGQVAAEFVADQAFSSFSHHADTQVSADDVRINFINSVWDWENGIDTNLVVDRILIDGVAFETEAPNVYSTGTWKAEDGLRPGYRRAQHLHTDGYFQFADSVEVLESPFVEANEGELNFNLSGPEVYNPQFDPTVGTVVTAFMENDPQDANDPWDILTNWNSAIDELVSIGMQEVTFAVYRVVENGYLTGGPTIATVNSAVQYASQKGLDVTLLPLFEAGGWRGEYNPTGYTRQVFQNSYTQLIDELAHIENIDRFNIGTELNAMVNDSSNLGFFSNLIATTESAFNDVGNESGRIGYAANFDAFDNAQHTALLNLEGIDFMGVSAYYSVIDPSDAWQVSGTGEVSQDVMDSMIESWNHELDRLEAFGIENDLPILIQEFGAVQENYAAAAPFAVNPSNWVADTLPDRYEDDAAEQAALVDSLIQALDQRGDAFEGVHFWTWENGSSRGERSYENAPADQPRYIERFAIWPQDGGAGEFIANFLATENDALQLNEHSIVDLQFDVVAYGGWGESENDTISVQLDGATVLSLKLADYDPIATNSYGYSGGDATYRFSARVNHTDSDLSIDFSGGQWSQFGVDNFLVKADMLS